MLKNIYFSFLLTIKIITGYSFGRHLKDSFYYHAWMFPILSCIFGIIIGNIAVLLSHQFELSETITAIFLMMAMMGLSKGIYERSVIHSISSICDYHITENSNDNHVNHNMIGPSGVMILFTMMIIRFFCLYELLIFAEHAPMGLANLISTYFVFSQLSILLGRNFLSHLTQQADLYNTKNFNISIVHFIILFVIITVINYEFIVKLSQIDFLDYIYPIVVLITCYIWRIIVTKRLSHYNIHHLRFLAYINETIFLLLSIILI